MTDTITKTAIPRGLHPTVFSRILEEGYGTGAWHGPDLKAAVADVAPEIAFQRPGPGRHSIAEIVLHHAWFVRSVIGQLTGEEQPPFLVKGEDWFELENEPRPTWPQIVAALDAYQHQLVEIGESRLSQAERFDLVLGITCHAVYHAGQIQLVKRLLGA